MLFIEMFYDATCRRSFIKSFLHIQELSFQAYYFFFLAKVHTLHNCFRTGEPVFNKLITVLDM